MKIRRKLQAFRFRNARNSANRFNKLQIDLSIMYKSDGHEELECIFSYVQLNNLNHHNLLFPGRKLSIMPMHFT
jgi:hypothetical protein